MKAKKHGRNTGGKGNRVRQAIRRKARREKRPPRQDKFYPLIDGNESPYPIAYCRHYRAYLTTGLENCHKCKKRGCPKYEELTLEPSKTELGLKKLHDKQEVKEELPNDDATE